VTVPKVTNQQPTTMLFYIAVTIHDQPIPKAFNFKLSPENVDVLT
jgi:hypothetical protein